MGTTPEHRGLLSTPVFTSAPLDRLAEIRHDPAAIARLLAESEPLAVLCDAHTNVGVQTESGLPTRLARRPWSGGLETAVLLGVEDGRPLLAVDIDAEPSPSDDPEATGYDPGAGAGAAPEMLSLREAGTALPLAESGLAAYLVGLMNWHRRHPHCSVCGARTALAEAGLSRKCPSCGTSHFPRTDPVVIMTVESEGRLLMGSRSGWPAERYSVLAGFISPGETPEEAVIREVQEESGIVCRDAEYVGSQPWPFPASLMLGFHAISDGGDPAPGGDEEMSDVRWFSRDEVIAMQRGKSDVVLPPEVSIARLLIDRWVATSG